MNQPTNRTATSQPATPVAAQAGPLKLTRRTFVATAAVVTSQVAAPAIVTASKTDSEIIIGEGEFKYRVSHHWPQLPDRFSWQTTHNVAVDQAGNLYVIHEGHADKQDHPSIFVFDPAGKFIRAFGQQFQGGGHGLEVRQEGNEEFLYVSAYQQVKSFAKLTLQGEVVWQQYAPMQSQKYAAGEAEHPAKIWGRDRFMPTNFAFLDDGGFLLADGYGSFFIHQYDAEGQWQRCFGGPGDGRGTFNTPHGLWIDRRGPEPVLVVTDRAHHTLQRFRLDGTYLDTIDGFGLPANVDIQGKWMLVPELVARVSILDEHQQVVAQLGSDVERVSADGAIRNDESKWNAGKFVHPHDACFAADSSIFVAEWVRTGRISKLEKLS